MAVGFADRHYPKFFSSLAEGEESHLGRIYQRKLEITALCLNNTLEGEITTLAISSILCYF